MQNLQSLALAASTVNLRAIFISLIIFFFISSASIFLSSPSSSFQPYIPSNVKFPDIHTLPGVSRVIGPGAHSPPQPPPPPALANSTTSSETWYSSWAWLNPFSSSSSDSKDENRVVLPIMPTRCTIYTYYDPKVEFDNSVNDTLLLIWRRAWWAQGFEPVILGPEEALKNDLSQKILHQKHSPRLRYEVMRFLAWNYMKGGIFVDYRAIPIGPHEDPALESLRHCEFPYLSRFKNQQGYIYSSSETDLDKLLNTVTEQNDTVTSIEEATKRTNFGQQISTETLPDLWKEDSEITSLAIYTPTAIEKLYNNLTAADLPNLINAHLHNNFLERFMGGVDILQPFKKFTDPLLHSTNKLAKKITTCPDSPWPYSCPPNRQKCKTCTTSSSPVLHSIPSLQESKKGMVLPGNKLTLSIVPHPYTLVAMINSNQTLFKSKDLPEEDTIDDAYLHAYSKENPWVMEVTASLLDEKLSAENRSVTLKKAIADLQESSRGLWTTSEVGWNIKEVEWQLGFSLPDVTVPDPSRKEDVELLERTHKFVNKNSGKGKAGRIMGVVEGWSKVDTEVWRFVRAVVERRELERREWVKKESGWGKGLGDERKGWWWKV